MKLIFGILFFAINSFILSSQDTLDYFGADDPKSEIGFIINKGYINLDDSSLFSGVVKVKEKTKVFYYHIKLGSQCGIYNKYDNNRLVSCGISNLNFSDDLEVSCSFLNFNEDYKYKEGDYYVESISLYNLFGDGLFQIIPIYKKDKMVILYKYYREGFLDWLFKYRTEKEVIVY